jgi:hypothetical protein
LIGPVHTRVRIVRHVEIARDRSIIVDHTAGSIFRAKFGDAEGGYTEAGSPRDILPQTRIITYASGLFEDGGGIVPGDWIEEVDTGVIWEMLEFVKDQRIGFSRISHVLSGIRLNEVYPFEADLTLQDGTVLAAGMPLAIWEQSELMTERGRTENLQGDCPIEFWEACENQNAQIRLPDFTYKITSSLLNRAQPNFTSAPHVSLRLRRAQ